MNDQRFCIPNIREQREQLERVDELLRCFDSAFYSEGKDCAGSVGQILLRKFVIRASRQLRIVHPLDGWVLRQMICNLQCVFRMTLHTEMQRLRALNELERVERRECCACVSQTLNASFED